MNTPKISVIVPIYKAEKYLRKCIDSILAQTFTDFELLLIDDGSPDNSGKICDEYAEKDSRIRVFHKENGGVSSARNMGIESSKGIYTIHVDPDDWIETGMLMALFEKARTEDADMVICDFYHNKKDTEIYMKQQPSSLHHLTVLKELINKLHGSCWNKLIKKECYTKYNISFPKELSIREDQYVCLSLCKNPIRISYLPQAFYHYVTDINENSLVKNVNWDMQILWYKMFMALLAGQTDMEYEWGIRSVRLCEIGLLDNRLSPKDYVDKLSILSPHLKISSNEAVKLRIKKIILQASFNGCYKPAKLFFKQLYKLLYDA